MRQDHDLIAKAWRSIRAEQDAPAVVVVSQDQQAAESRRLRESIARLEPTPSTVLLGGARANPAPYDWIATALHQRPTGELPASAEALAWLTQDTAAPPLRLEPTSLLRAAVDVVLHLAGPGPSVLVAEDVHALDPASIALLWRLSEASLPALFIFVTRPIDEDGYPKPAARLIKRLLERDAHFTQLEPQALRPAAALTETAWARYESAIENAAQATAATLRAAAHLVEIGQTDHARQLLGECVDASGETARPVLDRALRRVGERGEAERASAEDSDDLERHAGADLSALADLTGREVDVLRCLAAGMSNRHVAKTLGISVRTVTVHVSNLLRKTGTGSRTEAAIWAVQHDMHPG